MKSKKVAIIVKGGFVGPLSAVFPSFQQYSNIQVSVVRLHHGFAKSISNGNRYLDSYDTIVLAYDDLSYRTGPQGGEFFPVDKHLDLIVPYLRSRSSFYICSTGMPDHIYRGRIYESSSNKIYIGQGPYSYFALIKYQFESEVFSSIEEDDTVDVSQLNLDLSAAEAATRNLKLLLIS